MAENIFIKGRRPDGAFPEVPAALKESDKITFFLGKEVIKGFELLSEAQSLLPSPGKSGVMVQTIPADGWKCVSFHSLRELAQTLELDYFKLRRELQRGEVWIAASQWDRYIPRWKVVLL